MSIFRKNKKGVTLIELVVVIALLGIALSIVPMALNILNRSHATSVNEYEIQSSLRLTASKVSEIVRYSQAVFALPHEFIEDTTKLDPDWQFIALSPDSKSVVIYKYNTTTMTHEPSILVPAKDNIKYELLFTKKPGSINDKLLHFTIQAFVLSKDAGGNIVRTNSKVVYKTELAAINALQVVDKGTPLSPGVAIGFRKDDDTYGEGRNHVVKVALILDTSGSMAWIPGRDNVRPKEGLGQLSRLTHLKRAIIGNGLDGTSGIIAQFAVYPNFEVSIVPFANSAKYINNGVTGRPFFNAKLEKSDIVNEINSLSAEGGTNTGDGIRLSFYNMKDFVITGYKPNVEEHDFTIILVDGDSNFYSTITKNRTLYYHRWDDTSYNVENEESWNAGGDGFTYVTRLGDTILNEFNYTGEYYLIGYVTNPNSAGVVNIKNALNIPDNQVFLYSDSNFDLSEVFTNIATDIMAKTWLVTGPQIQE